MFDDNPRRADRLAAIRAAQSEVYKTVALALIGAVAFLAMIFVLAKPAHAESCIYANNGHVICLGSVAATPAVHRRHVALHHHKGKTPETESVLHAHGNKDAPELLLRKGEHYNKRTGMLTVPTAYGFPITVHPAFAAKFLKLFRLMKEARLHVDPRIIGCFSWGHKDGSNHHIGAACDDQWAKNRGPAYVYHMGPLLKAAGLFDGCAFRDCGHWEAMRGLYNRAPNSRIALTHFVLNRDNEALAWADRPVIEAGTVGMAPVITVSAHKSHRQHLARHIRRHHRQHLARQL